MQVDLSNFILPSFKQLFKNIINFKHYRCVIKGGRSSGKSVFVAMCLIIGTMIHKRSCVAIVRNQVGVTKRLDNVFIKALNILGMKDRFRYVSTRHEFILLNKNGDDTDISIMCTGADDPERLKGIQPKLGSYWALWIEEATNFSTLNSLKSLESSVGRGDLFHFISIISYNPRQNSNDFLNKEYETSEHPLNIEEDSSIGYYKYESSIDIDDFKLNQCVFHCTYKALIKYGHKDWISPADLVDITIGEKTNSDHYKWYYLGIPTGSDAINVFRNIRDWDGDTSSLNITKINRGLDVGNGGPDPFHYGEWYFDKKELNLYCLAEYNDKGGDTVIHRVAEGIRRINTHNLEFYIDSAVPLVKDMLVKEKLKPLPVKKAQGSVEAGILWLQSLQGIYICKSLTPVTYKEFTEYEYVIDKYEEVTNELPDKNNHSIDCCRYANYMNIRF